MTERNQLGGALGALNRGNSRDAEHIPLFAVALLDGLERGWLHANAAGCDGDPVGFLLATNIDHMGLALGVEMA